MFSEKTIQELFPESLTCMRLLQVGMMRNDLELVQQCLSMPEGQNAWSSHTLTKINKAIALAENLKVVAKKRVRQSLKFEYLVQKYNLINRIIKEVQTTPFISGPRSARSSLAWLCGSPHAIEDEYEIRKTFKTSRVVGLCQLLLPAHLEKAKLFNDEIQSKQYLDDLSAINSTVWDAYEKLPDAFTTLLQLREEISTSIHECSSINTITSELASNSSIIVRIRSSN